VILISDLHDLASSRLADADALFVAKRHAGAVYLCGYAVELVVKARICRTLGWDGVARKVSAQTGLPAWLLDVKGYPMERIGPATSQPGPQDVVMYFIDFAKPVPLRGWYVVREGREEFSEIDDDKATERACDLAKKHKVRCFKFRGTEPQQVDCGSVKRAVVY
jgi:hypothetical protein